MMDNQWRSRSGEWLDQDASTSEQHNLAPAAENAGGEELPWKFMLGAMPSAAGPTNWLNSGRGSGQRARGPLSLQTGGSSRHRRQRRRQILYGGLCLLILVVLAIVLGLALSSKDDGKNTSTQQEQTNPGVSAAGANEEADDRESRPTIARAGPVPALKDGTPLNQAAFIMAHDAGTGYMKDDSLVNRWIKTQEGSLTDQLNCGARALDLRPYQRSDTELLMHYKIALVDFSFRKAMEEVVTWANSNPEELVLVEINRCAGLPGFENACDGTTARVLDSLGISYIPKDSDCSELQEMSVLDAKERGRLSGGGYILVIWSTCFISNFNALNTCRGYITENQQYYSCAADGQNNDRPLRGMFDYLDGVHAEGVNIEGMLWKMQAFWTSTEVTMNLGSKESSSLLLDEKQSKLNSYIAGNITDARWGYPVGMNILDVHNVCDEGPKLFEAVRYAQ